MKRFRLFLIVLAGFLIGMASSAAWAQTTQVVGTFLDTGGNLITSGQITFNLKPGIDATISGAARFTPRATSCQILASVPSAGSMVRLGGTVNYTVVASTVAAGDYVQVENATDASFDGIFQALVTSPTIIEWSQALGNATTGGGTVSTLAPPVAGPCALTQNTAISPAGTYYSVALAPQFATTSVFNFYALGAGPVDLSTVTPTPGEMPAYSFVDTFSNQSIGGLKTFTAMATFSAGITGTGSLGGFTLGTGATGNVNTFTANQIFSTITSISANPSSTGFVRMASGDAIGWKNNANSGNLTISHNASDQLVSLMPVLAPGFISSSSTPALTGIVQLANTDLISWKNFAGSGDDQLGVNAADALTFNGVTVGYSPTTATSALYQQDFIDGAVGATWVTAVTGTAGASSVTSVLPHIGIEQLLTGGTTASTASLGTAPSFPGLGALGSIGGWQFRWIFQLSSTTSEQVQCSIAIEGGGTLVAPNDEIGIRYDTTLGDTNFTFVTAKAASRTSSASAVAADTNWHDVLVSSVTPGSVVFVLDGGSPITIATNVPVLATVFPQCAIENAANADKHLNVDFFGLNVSGLVR